MIGPSQVCRDKKTFGRRPVGLGVFATRPGRFTIRFRGKSCVTMLEKDMTKKQEDYAIASGKDVDYVIVSTHEDIIEGHLYWPWRINHSSESPTHILE